MDQITAFICTTFDKSTKVIDVKPPSNTLTNSIFYPELNVTQGLYVSKHHVVNKNVNMQILKPFIHPLK
jgi:hypothetical protein